MRLIDADAFKEYICNALEQTRQCYPDGGRWAETITEQFCLDIDEQPTATPEPHWIPVTERLPVEDGRYLVCGQKGGIYHANYRGGWWTQVGGGGKSLPLVVAWMPMPEPYKGVTE